MLAAINRIILSDSVSQQQLRPLFRPFCDTSFQSSHVMPPA